nr:EpsG family protein [Sphingomonas brevis]
MLVYWLLFSFFAVGTLLTREGAQGSRYSYTFLSLGGLLIAIVIGFRYEVGGDWFPYQRLLSFARIATFRQLLDLGDPGYQLLNWLAVEVGARIWLVNLICGAIFAWGLVAFARAQPNPWLAITIAVPYLVIVVAMGYSRQGVAIGILMAGLARLLRGGTTLQFLFYAVAAALFHRTAIVLVPLVILAGSRSRTLNLILALALGFVFYDLFFSSAAERFIRDYIGAEYNSEGAAVRIAMSIVPATIFLLGRRRFEFSSLEDRLWRNFSFAAFASLGLLYLLPSSTAVDRMALYLMPMQVAIFSRIPQAYRTSFTTPLILVYAFAVQFVWLNYADNASEWLPYQSYLFN